MGANRPDDKAPDRNPKSEKRRKGRHKSRARGALSKRAFETAVLVPSPERLATIDCSLDDAEFVVFDIETTGGNPERNAITEIFAIKFKNGVAAETFGTLVDPEMPIPPIVRRMTGITNAMVRGAPRISDVMPEFLKFVGSGILVSHNTIGDIKFIRHFAKEVAAVNFDNFYMCTHLLVEKLTPEAPDKSLKGLAGHFELASGEFHRAEADTHVTLALFRVLLERLRGLNVRRVMDAVRLQGDLESALRLGWGVSSTKLEDIPEKPGVWRLYDHDQKLLFLSSSSHLERDLGRLKAFDQLPKQLMRLVLRSSDLSYTTCANLFTAMMEECDELAKADLPIAPSQWHQRAMQLLFVKEHEDGLRVDIGPLEDGVKYAYGPIRDRRQAQDFLKHLADSLGGKVTRRGLLLPASVEQTLVDYFKGSLATEAASLGQKKRSIRLWFQPKERKQLSARLDILERLLSFSKPKWDDMLNRRGVIVVPGDNDREWIVYSIAGSMPISHRLLSGSAEVVREYLFSEELSEEISQAEESTGRLLSKDLANRINSTIWWMYSVRGESRFIPLKDLGSKQK